jgi:hypothetical protein
VELHAEAGRLAAEHRLAAPGAHGEIDQVAEGVVDAHPGDAADQEGQREAEAEVVVDGGQQHHQERQREGQPEAGGSTKMRRCPRVIGPASGPRPGTASAGGARRWPAMAAGSSWQRHGLDEPAGEGVGPQRCVAGAQAVAGHGGQHGLHVFRQDVVAPAEQRPGPRRREQPEPGPGRQAEGEAGASRLCSSRAWT